MRHLPNLFTLLNLFFGCLAIVFILQPGEGILNYAGEEWKVWLPEKIWWGSICIFLAAGVDFLDGFVARLFKATSEMGKQLDSLADVVSFGVAPGLILYQLLRISFAGEVGGLDIPIAWLVPVFILPMATAWRLAKFNLDEGQTFSFKGLPSPASGLFVAALPLVIFYNEFDLQTFLTNRWVIYGIAVALSWLMISDLPLMGLKFSDFSFRNNLPKWILAAVAVVSALLLHWLAIPFIIIAYILLSLIYKKPVS